MAALGPLAKAGTVEDATNADIIVVSTPLKVYKTYPADKLAGKIVIGIDLTQSISSYLMGSARLKGDAY